MLVSARGAQKTREDSKKLQMYSKQWLPGDSLRLFLPVFFHDGIWDIAVGAIWGHKVNDFEGIGLKTTFIPSLTEFDENGDPVGPPDITYQFSRIARVFIDGQHALEEEKLQNKKWPTEAARKEALQKLDYQYDTKNNMKAIKPAIGMASYYISTEVLCLKMVNDVPATDNIAVASFPMSSQRIDQLYAILQDIKYAPQEGEEFLEIEWKYPANPDKAASARAANPSGLTSEYRLINKHPEAYKLVSGMFNLVSRDAESIVRRATKKIDEARIRGALTQYCIMNSEDIDACNSDNEEVLVKNASLIHELRLDQAITNENLIAKLNEELANRTAADAAAPAGTTVQPDLTGAAQQDAIAGTVQQPDLAGTVQQPDLGAQPVPGVQVQPDLGAQTAADQTSAAQAAAEQAQDLAASVQNVQGAPTAQSLLQNNHIADMTDGELSEVNLEMM